MPEEVSKYPSSVVKLTLPGNFADPTFVSAVPDVCEFANEWPANLWPYFNALLGSFGDYDWRPALAELAVPRLVLHGREDRITFEGGRLWALGFEEARFVASLRPREESSPATYPCDLLNAATRGKSDNLIT